MPLLAAHINVMAVFVVRARVVVMFRIVTVAMSVFVFEFHLSVDAVLNLFEEIQDILIVAQVSSAALNSSVIKALYPTSNESSAKKTTMNHAPSTVRGERV